MLMRPAALRRTLASSAPLAICLWRFSSYLATAASRLSTIATAAGWLFTDSRSRCHSPLASGSPWPIWRSTMAMMPTATVLRTFSGFARRGRTSLSSRMRKAVATSLCRGSSCLGSSLMTGSGLGLLGAGLGLGRRLRHRQHHALEEVRRRAAQLGLVGPGLDLGLEVLVVLVHGRRQVRDHGGGLRLALHQLQELLPLLLGLVVPL